MSVVTEKTSVLVWDLDGTLVDSIADIHQALNHVLIDYKLSSLSLAQSRSMIGAGAGKLLDRAFAAVNGQAVYQRDEAYQRFIDYYTQHSCEESQLYPRVSEALAGLSVDGYRHAICTNKPEAIARSVVQQLAIDHHFEVIVGGDTTEFRKPHAAPLQHCLSLMGAKTTEAVMIGDSAADVGVARAAGIPVIVLPWGYRNEDIADLNADRVAENADALVACLRHSQRGG